MNLIFAIRGKMPRLVQPLKMRQLALQSLAVHFEPVAYGCPRGPILSRMVEDDSYLTVDSPFAHWRELSFSLSLSLLFACLFVCCVFYCK